MRGLNKTWIGLDGQRWLFDEASWELADWFVIKNATGLGRVPFLNGVLNEEPDALQALIWFLRRKDEPNLRLEEVQFRPAAVEYEPADPPEPDADPPSAGGDAEPPSTSKSGATTTSRRSRAPTATPAGMSTP